MPLARRLRRFLKEAGAEFQVVRHTRADTAREAARAAHVPEERTAKSVLLRDQAGYLVALLPASRRIALDALGAILRRRLTVAREDDVGEIFPDCERGSVPAVARPYGLPIVIDESLLEGGDLYFEAGDRAELVHMRAAEFLRLVAGAPRACFTVRPASEAPGP